MKKTQEDIIQNMQASKVIPVFSHTNIETVKKIMETTYENGLHIFEFTIRQPNAKEVFTELKKTSLHLDNIILGVGTILNPRDAEEFLSLGAEFLVSPVFIPELADLAKEKDVLWIPGCSTIAEVYNALQVGCSLIKLFPANLLKPGLVDAIQSVFGTTESIKLMITGGITTEPEILNSWFSKKISCIGMGSQLFKKEFIENNDFKSLSIEIRKVLEDIEKIQSKYES